MSKVEQGGIESLNCRECGKPIAAAWSASALCVRCRYGQMVNREDARHEPDALELMRRNAAMFNARGHPDYLVVCHTCGLEPKSCACHLR